ncbi:MAG: hypothetical protein B7X34_01000, partial [Acidobacteriia bacterium 12-62-4]
MTNEEVELIAAHITMTIYEHLQQNQEYIEEIGSVAAETGVSDADWALAVFAFSVFAVALEINAHLAGRGELKHLMTEFTHHLKLSQDDRYIIFHKFYSKF